MSNSNTPVCPKGLSEFIATVEGIQLTCFYEYEGPIRGAREHGTGQQLEPDYEPTLEVCNVYAGGDTDIMALLSGSAIIDIINQIIKSMENQDGDYYA